MRFPDPNSSQPDGLLCVGGVLSVDLLREAYSQGIFPWPQEGYPILWFSPPQRGILEFKEFSVSRSLKKTINKLKNSVQMTINRDFKTVIYECAAAKRAGQKGTWILPGMIDAYIALHEAGEAHSFELWEEGELVAGLYGVYIAGVFSAESMFFKKSNRSKVLLSIAIDYFISKDLDWIDIQMVTDHLAAMGGKYITREEFLSRLRRSAATALQAF